MWWAVYSRLVGCRGCLRLEGQGCRGRTPFDFTPFPLLPLLRPLSLLRHACHVVLFIINVRPLVQIQIQSNICSKLKLQIHKYLSLMPSHTEPREVRHLVLLFPKAAHPEHPVILHVLHVPPVKPFLHLSPCKPVPHVRTIHTRRAPPDLWASMRHVKEVPLATSTREPRVVKRRTVRSNKRLHRGRFALALTTHRASPRIKERKIELGNLDAVAVCDELQERPPVVAMAHTAGDRGGCVVPPDAAKRWGPRERDGDGRGVDVRLPAAGHKHDRAHERRPVLGERARRHLEAARRQPRALAVVSEPERVERLERPPERGTLVRDGQCGRHCPVVVHLDLVHRRVGDPDQPRLFFEHDKEAQLRPICTVPCAGDPPCIWGGDWANCEGFRSSRSVTEI